MIVHNIVQIIFLLAGATALLAALFNWDWFFTAQNSQFIMQKLGRKRARLVYGAIGAIFIFAAFFFYYKISHP